MIKSLFIEYSISVVGLTVWQIENFLPVAVDECKGTMNVPSSNIISANLYSVLGSSRKYPYSPLFVLHLQPP